MSTFAAGPVPALALSPCSTRVAAAAGQNHVSLVSLPPSPSEPLSSAALPRPPSLFDVPSVKALCFPSPSVLYAADGRGSFKRLAASDKLSEQYTVAAAHGGDELTDIAALSHSSPITTSGKDGSIRLWDPETRQSIAKLTGHRYEVRGIAVASSSDATGADVTILASAGRDKTVRLWDVRAGSAKEVQCLRGHAGWVHAVALGNTGAGPPIAVSSGGDKTVRVWDLIAMKERSVMRGHEYRVWGLALATDSSFAVTGSTDATVRAWKLGEDEGECHVYEGHSDSVLSVDVARNGVFAVSGCEDGALFMWDCATLFGRNARKDMTSGTLIDVDPVSEPVQKEAAGGNTNVPKQLDTKPLVMEKQTQRESILIPGEIPGASRAEVAKTSKTTATPEKASRQMTSYDPLHDTGMTTDGLKAAASITVEQEPKFDKSAAELVKALKRIKDLENALQEAHEKLKGRDKEIAVFKKSTQEKDLEMSILQRQIESSQNLVNAANVRALLAANPRKVDETLDYEEPVNKIGAVSDKLSALVARLDAMVATN